MEASENLSIESPSSDQPCYQEPLSLQQQKHEEGDVEKEKEDNSSSSSSGSSDNNSSSTSNNISDSSKNTSNSIDTTFNSSSSNNNSGSNMKSSSNGSNTRSSSSNSSNDSSNSSNDSCDTSNDSCDTSNDSCDTSFNNDSSNYSSNGSNNSSNGSNNSSNSSGSSNNSSNGSNNSSISSSSSNGNSKNSSGSSNSSGISVSGNNSSGNGSSGSSNGSGINGSNGSTYVQQQLAQIDEKMKEISKRLKGDDETKPNPAKSLTQEPTKDQTFVIQGGNGSAIVEQVLLRMGWKRVEKSAESFKLKWVEIRNAINFDNFREGEQMVNRIPNCYLLTNKLGMLITLQRFDRIRSLLNLTNLIRLRTEDFLPETYRLCDPSDRQLFMQRFKPGDVWISKPTAMNQGRGIQLIRDISEFIDEECGGDSPDVQKKKITPDRVIQRYIKNPLLLENRKFDIRAYMLVACTKPYMVYFHKGYARLCLQHYSVESEDLLTHLTNQFIQKKDAAYEFFKEDTVWSMEKLNSYINRKVAPHKNIESDWVHKVLKNKLKSIMLYCFHAVKSKLQAKVGYFDLYGFDFMVDDNMKVWLIEINANPSMSTNCTALRELVPGLLHETLHLSIECFEKARRNAPVTPVKSQRNFETIYEGKPFGSSVSFDRNSPTDPVRPSDYFRGLQLTDRGRQFAVAASAWDQDENDSNPTSMFEVRRDKAAEKSRGSRERGKFTLLSVQEPVGTSSSTSSYPRYSASTPTECKENNCSSSSLQKEQSSESSTANSVKLSRVVFSEEDKKTQKEGHVGKGKSKSSKNLNLKSDTKSTNLSKPHLEGSRVTKGASLRSRQSSPTLRSSARPTTEDPQAPAATFRTRDVITPSFYEEYSATKSDSSKLGEIRKDWSKKGSTESVPKPPSTKYTTLIVGTNSESEPNKSLQSLVSSTKAGASASANTQSEVKKYDSAKAFLLSPALATLEKQFTQTNTNARISSIDTSSTGLSGCPTLSTVDCSDSVSHEKVVPEHPGQNSYPCSSKRPPTITSGVWDVSAKDLLKKDIVVPDILLSRNKPSLSNVTMKNVSNQEAKIKQRENVKPLKSINLIRSRISLSSSSIAEQPLGKHLAVDFKANMRAQSGRTLTNRTGLQTTSFSLVNSGQSPRRRLSYDRIDYNNITSHPYVQYKNRLLHHHAKQTENIDPLYRYQAAYHDPANIFNSGATKDNSILSGGPRVNMGHHPLSDPAGRLGTLNPGTSYQHQPLINPWSPWSGRETTAEGTRNINLPDHTSRIDGSHTGRIDSSHTGRIDGSSERRRMLRMGLESSGSNFPADYSYRYMQQKIHSNLPDSHFNNSNSSSVNRSGPETRGSSSRQGLDDGLQEAWLYRRISGPASPNRTALGFLHQCTFDNCTYPGSLNIAYM